MASSIHDSRWAGVPFEPRRVPFFYGWVMLAGSVLAIWASVPGQTMGVGVFTDALVEAWGLSRLQLSTAYMAGTIVSSFILPYAGKLLDVMGGRVMVTVSSLGLGISLCLLAVADRIVPEARSGVGLLIAMVAMVFVFLCLRFFGQGCLALVSRVAIGKWFQRYRGRATAVAGVFTAFGFNSSPMVLNHLIATYGWRNACFILAAAIGGGMTVIGWLLYRDNPEQCGLRMDGAAETADDDQPHPATLEIHHEFTRGEAIRTVPFWVFGLALAAHGLIMTALTFHIAALGRETGLTEAQAFSVFWPMSFFSIGGNVASGWLGDKMRLKYLLMAMLAAEMVGSLGVLYLGLPWGRLLLAIGYGTAGGFFVNLVTVVWPRYFGRKHLGAISGLHMSIMVFTSALGPVLFSAIHSLTGGFRSAVMAWLLVPIVLFLFSFRADNPQTKYAGEDNTLL